MKKVFCLLALGGILAAQQAFAIPVKDSRTAGYFTSPGGEFTIKLDASATPADAAAFNAIYQNYASVATLSGGFQTFCIESTVHVGGNPKDATLDPNGVAVGTAWLYEQFGRGVLAGYDYTPGAGRAASAWELQNAIWALQGSYVYDAGAATGYLNAAIAQFGSLANAQVQNTTYRVDALRMTTTDATGQQVVRQPMLALVPDGATTMMLLGMSMLGIGYTRRLLAK